MGTFAFTREEFTKIQKEIFANLEKEENFDFYDNLFERRIDEQIDYLHKNGMEALFEINNMNYQVYEKFSAYVDGKIESMYDASEGLEEPEEVYQLITSFGIYDMIADKLDISRDCARAIVGTVITTIGAIGIGGPVGAGLWLIRKGYNTYKLIKACS